MDEQTPSLKIYNICQMRVFNLQMKSGNHIIEPILNQGVEVD